MPKQLCPDVSSSRLRSKLPVPPCTCPLCGLGGSPRYILLLYEPSTSTTNIIHHKIEKPKYLELPEVGGTGLHWVVLVDLLTNSLHASRLRFKGLRLDRRGDCLWGSMLLFSLREQIPKKRLLRLTQVAHGRGGATPLMAVRSVSVRCPALRMLEAHRPEYCLGNGGGCLRRTFTAGTTIFLDKLMQVAHSVSAMCLRPVSVHAQSQGSRFLQKPGLRTEQLTQLNDIERGPEDVALTIPSPLRASLFGTPHPPLQLYALLSGDTSAAKQCDHSLQNDIRYGSLSWMCPKKAKVSRPHVTNAIVWARTGPCSKAAPLASALPKLFQECRSCWQ